MSRWGAIGVLKAEAQTSSKSDNWSKPEVSLWYKVAGTEETEAEAEARIALEELVVLNQLRSSRLTRECWGNKETSPGATAPGG